MVILSDDFWTDGDYEGEEGFLVGLEGKKDLKEVDNENSVLFSII